MLLVEQAYQATGMPSRWRMLNMRYGFKPADPKHEPFIDVMERLHREERVVVVTDYKSGRRVVWPPSAWKALSNAQRLGPVGLGLEPASLPFHEIPTFFK